MRDTADTGVAPPGAAADAGPGAAGRPAAQAASAKALSFVRRVLAILVGQFFSFYHDQVAAIFGLLWLLQFVVIRSMVSAELASTAIRLQDVAPGGAYATHQV
jgi:hypothetical protein